MHGQHRVCNLPSILIILTEGMNASSVNSLGRSIFICTGTCQCMCRLGSPCYGVVPQMRQVIPWTSNHPVQWRVNRSHDLNILLLNSWQLHPFNTHYCDLLMLFLPIHVLWIYFSENWSKTWLFSFRKTPLNTWVSKCPVILSGSQYVYIVVTRMTQLWLWKVSS